MYIGIDLGGTNIAAGLVDENAKIIGIKSVPTGGSRDPEEIVKDMAAVATEVVKENGYKMDEVKWIGIGSPGSVNRDTGVLIYANNINFKNTPVRDMMKKYIDKPIFLDNDANCAAYGESVAGATKGANHSIAITLGTGVGGGIIIDGKIYSGFNFNGAELGHMVINVDGYPCTCGRKGCWEAYASATALIRQTKEAAENNKDSLLWKYHQKEGKFSGRTAFLAAKDGDITALKVIDKYLHYLSAGIISIINIFQPEILVIGGGISNEGEGLLEPIRKSIAKEIYTMDMPQTKIVRAQLGNNAGIIGAAFLGRQ